MTALKKPWPLLSDEERIAWVRECRWAGLTGDRMGELAGVPPTSIGNWLRTRKLKLTSFPEQPREIEHWPKMKEPARREALVATIAGGAKGISEVARRLDCSPAAVRTYVQKHGITVPAYVAPAIIKVYTPKAKPAVPKPAVRLPPRPTDQRDFPHKKHLLETKRLDCRFPLWGHDEHPKMDTMFVCGAPVEHEQTSYCAECRDVTLKVRLSSEESQRLAVRAAWLRRGISQAPKQ